MDGRRHVMGSGRRAVVVVAALGSFLAVSLAGTALAQSSSSSAASSVSSAPITFVEGSTNDISTVNPWNALETPEYEVLSLNFDLLLNFDKANLAASPGLATAWTQSPDGLTWTFTIRDDATWHDGTPLTANDIAYTYNKTLDCQLGNSLDYLVPDYTKSITAPNDTTLVWTMNTPNTAPLTPPWVYIVPEHIWGDKSCSEIKKAPFFEDGEMIGSGPFEMTEWNKGESWTMTANKDYWGGSPQIDRFVVKKYNNNEAMITALKTGEVDYIGNDSAIPVDLFNQLQSEAGSQGITTHVGPLTQFDQMSFNMCDPDAADAAPYCAKTGSTGNPALRDPELRKAIEMAIDRATIISRVYQGYAQPGTTIVPPFASLYHLDPTEPVQFSIDGANQLLDQAGYADTDGDGIRNDKANGGENLDFRFILRSESGVEPQLGKYISGWLNQIGIKTETQILTDSKLVDAWYANDYDLYIWGWAPDPDPDFILSTFTSGQCGSWSDTCYGNPEYDQLYKDQKTATTQDERVQIIKQMQDIIYNDTPEIVLDYYNSLEAYNSAKWQGLEDNVSPQPQGFLWGQYTPYSALTLAPRVGGATTTSSGGIPAIAWVGIIAGVGIVAAGVIAFARRRSTSDEDLA
jgi:peptide/nickel transport system substrate-binding protein